MRAQWLAVLSLVGGCAVELNLGQNHGATELPGAGGMAPAGEGGSGDQEECSAADSSSGFRAPLDLILVVDNSDSMRELVVALQQTLNTSIRQQFEATGLDYRIIVFSRYGNVNVPVGESEHPICVEPPLGVTDCESASSGNAENNPPRFFHYSADVDSSNALCRMNQGLDRADELSIMDRPWTPVAPSGWTSLLRPSAFKAIVFFTDLAVNCEVGEEIWNDRNEVGLGEEVARAFQEELVSQTDGQFGTVDSPQVRFFSMVGVETPSSGLAHLPESPSTASTCDAHVRAGTTYQALSKRSGGTVYSICDTSRYQDIFEDISLRVGEVVACSPSN